MAISNIYKLSLVMDMIDKISAPLKTVGKGLTGALSAGAFMGAGNMMIGTVSTLAETTHDTQRAIGELASLGVRDFVMLENAAKNFTQTWAGTSKAEFITAAYDIKSGIASLTDYGVAKYTEIAGLTAKATKGNTAEMTSLFATGYGIYKDYYSQISDLEFAEMFSAGISKSVQQFKTDGSKMSQAVQTLGAAGTNALIPLEEQFAVLGMLQATMGGAEAGTKYKAFFKSAAKAGQELNLSFTDVNNQLLSMPDILTLIRGKYGDVMDANEKMELQKAFGTEEAVALIDLLYGKVDLLKGNVVDLKDAMGDGTKVAMDMATLIDANGGSYQDILNQSIQSLKETFGNSVAPVYNFAIRGLITFVQWIDNFIDKYPWIATIIAGILSIGGAVAIVIGALITLVGVTSFFISNFKNVYTTISLVGKGIKLMFSANPAVLMIIGIVVAVVAVIAVIYSLWKNWDTVTNYIGNAIQKLIGWFNGLSPGVQAVLAAMFPFISIPMMIITNWGTITGFFSSLWLGISTTFSNGIMNVKNIVNGAIEWFRNSGRRIMETFAAGIRSAIMAPVNAARSGLQKIRNMLPFSDAKTGPLSTLTLSGIRTMTTISEGIRKADNSPAKAVSRGFTKINFKENDKKIVKKIKLGSSLETPLSESKASAKGKEIRIGNLVLNVKLDEIEDFKKLKKLLLELEDLDFGNYGEGEVVPA